MYYSQHQYLGNKIGYLFGSKINYCQYLAAYQFRAVIKLGYLGTGLFYTQRAEINPEPISRFLAAGNSTARMMRPERMSIF